MSSLSHTHIAGQRKDPSVPSSMTSLFCISSCLRIYLEQQSSCRISYRPPILTSLRQRIWPSLYLMLYQESAQTLSGKKSNNKQQTQAQHILHARKGRPRKLDVCGGPDRENTDRQYWWHENALFLPSYRQVDGGNEKALFNRGKWCTERCANSQPKTHIVFGQTTSAAHGPTLWCQWGKPVSRALPGAAASTKKGRTGTCHPQHKGVPFLNAAI